MLDSRNVNRGHCTSCKEGECIEYEISASNECNYCKCPPTAHQRIEATPQTAAPNSTQNGEESEFDLLEDPDELARGQEAGPSSLSQSMRKRRNCNSSISTPSTKTRKSKKGIKIPTNVPTRAKTVVAMVCSIV